MAQDKFGDCPLLQAAKWAPTCDLEALFEADLQRRIRAEGRSHRDWPGSGEVGAEDRLYWGDWKFSAGATHWNAARLITFNASDFLSLDVDDKIRKVAFVVLAKKHVAGVVRDAANTVSPARRETLRKELASILRDYRTMNHEIPVSWVDRLLQLS